MFANKLGCSKSPYGGISTWLLNLSKHLSLLDNINVHTWTVSEDISSDKTIEHGLITMHFSPVTHGLRTRTLTLFAEDKYKLRKKAHEINPDLLHAHHTGEYAFTALNEDIPSVITVHGIYGMVSKAYNAKMFSVYWFMNIVERLCFKKAKYMISINPYVRDYVSRYYRNRLFAIENPVTELFYQNEDKSEADTLLFVAVLSPIKDLHRLVDVIEKVKKRRPMVRLKIVGLFPPGLEWYQKQVSENVLAKGLRNNIYFLGPGDDTKIAEELSRTRCLLLTSKQETAPTVISEAMAAGKPVVAMDVGGVRYMVRDGATGYLVPPGDTQAMAERVIRILEDEMLRREMGEAARKEALQRFHPDLVARKTLAVYEEILQMEHKR